MKNLRITIVATLIALSALGGFQVYGGVKVNVSVFTSIPIAPNAITNIKVKPACPINNAIWIDGYWNWNPRTNSYVWEHGHWIIPPYNGAVWMPGYWSYTPRGYVWVDAAWVPKNQTIAYGYCQGRYDYYGRPVYYHKPTQTHGHGYAYKYDHRPEYKKNKYSSNPHFNSQNNNKATNKTVQTPNTRPSTRSVNTARTSSSSERTSISTRENTKSNASTVAKSNNKNTRSSASSKSGNSTRTSSSSRSNTSGAVPSSRR